MASTRHWPYSFEINDHNRIDAERWCYERFKSRNWRDYESPSKMIGLQAVNCIFYFKRAQDASIFSLRWA